MCAKWNRGRWSERSAIRTPDIPVSSPELVSMLSIRVLFVAVILVGVVIRG